MVAKRRPALQPGSHGCIELSLSPSDRWLLPAPGMLVCRQLAGTIWLLYQWLAPMGAPPRKAPSSLVYSIRCSTSPGVQHVAPTLYKDY